MKSSLFLTSFIICSLALPGLAGDWQLLPSGKYGHGDINGNSSSKWYVTVPADTMGVITLKNKGRRSDIDVFAYSRNSTELGRGVKGNQSTELVVIPPESTSRYVYVDIRNVQETKTNYEFYFHTVDPVARAGEAFVKAGFEALLTELFGAGDDSDAQADIGRASTLLFSALKEENLANTTKSMFLNELTMAMKKELGYGFAADLAVNYVVVLADDILKNYW
jgi:hypothetical protein